MDLVEYMLHEIAAHSKEDIRAAMLGLKTQWLADPNSLPSSSCPVKDVFAPGVYAREMSIPKGVLLMGKLHRTEHINVISKGRLKVLTENGVVEIVAPYTFVSGTGTQRLGYALEDTVWTTFHPTIETDLAKIEALVVAEDYSDIELTAEYAVD